MRTLSRSTSIAIVFSSLCASMAVAQKGSELVVGSWDACLTSHGVVIPFRLDIAGSGPDLRGIFYDGFKPYDGTTSATLQDGKLVLKVEQHGAEVAASILRVDGDTGAYSGTFKDGKWVLSRFDGSRPGVIEVSQANDGTLVILQISARPQPSAAQGDASTGANQTVGSTNITKSYAQDETDSRYVTKLVAYRADVAQAKGLPQPEDYDTHTRVRDPNEKFTFSFPDVNGRLVSNDDPRFKGKVILAIVTGTWCPNRHDEAQYLVQLDKKYREKGLAIVALDFEEPDQRESLQRQRAFVKKYGVQYTYLIAGAPSDIGEKLPQLVNLNTWPATVFVGRDGLVKGVHSGFASPASGQFNNELQRDFVAKIEQLLAQDTTQVRLSPQI